MLGLVSIVNRILGNSWREPSPREISEILDVDNLDSGVFRAFGELKENEFYRLKEEKNLSKLSAYREGLRSFAGGLENGLTSMGFNPSPHSSAALYEKGYSVGHKTKTEQMIAKRAGNHVESETYQRLITQLQGVLEVVDKELELLEQASKDPYGFLINRLSGPLQDLRETTPISDAILGYAIDAALAQIIKPYKHFIERLSRGPLSKEEVMGMVKEFPDFDDHVKLGIVYMTREERTNARMQFIQAQRFIPRTADLHQPLELVHSNMDVAYETFTAAYSRIQIAQQIGINGQKG